MIRMITILTCISLFSGCVPRIDRQISTVKVPEIPTAPVIPPPAILPATVTPDEPIDRITIARQEIARLRADLAKAEELERQAVADRDDARKEASLAPVRLSIAWATWVGVAIGTVSLALLIASLIWAVPVGRKILGGVIGAAYGLAALAQGIGFALPWFGLVGIIAIVLAILVAAGLIVARLWPVLVAHAQLADAAESAEDSTDKMLSQAKVIAAKLQAKAGIDKIIDRIRDTI